MDKLNALAPRTMLLAAAGLLLIDTFFAWQKVSAGPISVSANAWHGFLGVFMGLMVIALIVVVGAGVAKVALPAGVPWGLITLALGALIAIFAVLKNLVDDYSAWGSYLGIVFAVGVALGAWRVFGESGESLPSSLESMTQRATDQPAEPSPGE
jgi:hypothetical protein